MDLPTAAKLGNLDQIRAHIFWKTDLNRRNPQVEDATPLYLATAYGHTDAALLLLEAGADPKITSPSQLGDLGACCLTPLHTVKSATLARALLDHGADVRANDGHGGTPIEFAAFIRNREIVELELARGADINAGSMAPLLNAVMDNPDTAFVHFLLAHGANPNVHTGTGWSLIDLARDAEGRGKAPGLTVLIEQYLPSGRR